MYKAIDTCSNKEIIILSPEWENRISDLRSMGQKDILVCQGCKQPVKVKAGSKRRPHFAHKHLLSCKYGTESPEILATRAVLYRWLLSKFKEGVTLEKTLEGYDLPRPIDCFVEYREKIFAYWIIDGGIKAQVREEIRDAFRETEIMINWVFVGEMMRIAPEHNDHIHLSTTEREFSKKCDYDEIIVNEKRYSETGKTIHYLSANTETVTTFRSLHLLHQPNVFSGRKLSNSLAELKISPRTGEFVHGDEYNELEESRKLRKKLQQIDFDIQTKVILRNPIIIPKFRNPILSFDPGVSYRTDNPPKTERRMDAGICIHCGETTTDWWNIWSDQGVRKCECQKCKNKGIVKGLSLQE